MTMSYALHGLVRKHVEIQTNLRELEDAADKAEDELNQIASAIRILDPEYPVDTLRPKRRRQRRIHSDQGNLKRHIGAFITAQAQEFTSADVKKALLDQGLVSAKRSDMTYLTLRIAIHLKQMAAHGIIKEVYRLRGGDTTVWRPVAR